MDEAHSPAKDVEASPPATTEPGEASGSPGGGRQRRRKLRRKKRVRVKRPIRRTSSSNASASHSGSHSGGGGRGTTSHSPGASVSSVPGSSEEQEDHEEDHEEEDTASSSEQQQQPLPQHPLALRPLSNSGGGGGGGSGGGMRPALSGSGSFTLPARSGLLGAGPRSGTPLIGRRHGSRSGSGRWSPLQADGSRATPTTPISASSDGKSSPVSSAGVGSTPLGSSSDTQSDASSPSPPPPPAAAAAAAAHHLPTTTSTTTNTTTTTTTTTSPTQASSAHRASAPDIRMVSAVGSVAELPPLRSSLSDGHVGVSSASSSSASYNSPSPSSLPPLSPKRGRRKGSRKTGGGSSGGGGGGGGGGSNSGSSGGSDARLSLSGLFQEAVHIHGKSLADLPCHLDLPRLIKAFNVTDSSSRGDAYEPLSLQCCGAELPVLSPEEYEDEDDKRIILDRWKRYYAIKDLLICLARRLQVSEWVRARVGCFVYHPKSCWFVGLLVFLGGGSSYGVC